VTGKEAFTHSTHHSIYDHNDTYLPDTASDDPIASRAKTSQGRKHLPQTPEGLLAPGVKAWAKKGVWEGPVCLGLAQKQLHILASQLQPIFDRCLVRKLLEIARYSFCFAQSDRPNLNQI
jgi:hypothetical protein